MDAPPLPNAALHPPGAHPACPRTGLIHSLISVLLARPPLFVCPHALQSKAARQAGPLPEVQAGAGEVVAEGVTKQKVVQPNRKMLEAGSAVDISQVLCCDGLAI